jgi:hypothetical protein
MAPVAGLLLLSPALAMLGWLSFLGFDFVWVLVVAAGCTTLLLPSAIMSTHDLPVAGCGTFTCSESSM